MNNRNLAILAGIFGVLLLIAVYPYFKPQLENLGLNSDGGEQTISTPNNPTLLEFYMADETEPENRFENESGTWLVNGYIADQELVETMIDDLSDLHVDSLVSTNTEKFASYEASDSGHYVKIANSSGQESEIIIGKEALQPGTVYIRPRIENKVYMVQSDMGSYLFTPEEYWRDKFILDENPDSISSIEISRNGQKLLIQPNEQGQWQASYAGENRIVGEVALERLFDVLSPLEGRGIANEAQERLFEVSRQQVYVTINPVEGSEPLRLVLLDDQDNSVWLIKLEDGEYLYTINPAVANTLVETNFTLFE